MNFIECWSYFHRDQINLTKSIWRNLSILRVSVNSYVMYMLTKFVIWARRIAFRPCAHQQSVLINWLMVGSATKGSNQWYVRSEQFKFAGLASYFSIVFLCGDAITQELDGLKRRHLLDESEFRLILDNGSFQDEHRGALEFNLATIPWIWNSQIVQRGSSWVEAF